MQYFKVRFLVPALALLLIGTALGMKIDSAITDRDTYDQLQKLENAFIVINQRYVDEVSAGQLAEDAIAGMLDGLDPHSTYISAEQIREVREGYRGSFGGIGIWFEMREDTARVVSPISDGPSEQVGVMPGDRIVAIEDSSAVGISTSEIQQRLKGEIGTEVEVTMLRPATERRVDFVIERDEIPLYSIENAQMVDEETGYIKISRFAMTTYDEFMEAMRELKGQGMERLVLDLRRNPGGVMEAAVKIADEFLDEGQAIVRTKGRSEQLNQEIRATGGDSFEEQPVIVLVDQFSASASEILAGALQDHDRALIVGQRTFGKGLVQNQFPLPDESVLQMTVARYYTPAGRLIQTPYESGDQEDYYERKFASFEESVFDLSEYTEQIADSLRYETDHGRIVFGGGGILPDFVIQPDTAGLVPNVRRGGLDLTFARQWFGRNEQELRARWGERPVGEFADEFDVSNEMWNAFWEHAEEQGLSLTTRRSAVAPEDGIFAEEDAVASRSKLETFLTFRLAQVLYGTRAAAPIGLEIDNDLAQALSLWERASTLAAYHTGPRR